MEVFNLDLGEAGGEKTYLRLIFNNSQDLSDLLSRDLKCEVTRLGEENFWVSSKILEDDNFPDWGRRWIDELTPYEDQSRLLYHLAYTNHLFAADFNVLKCEVAMHNLKSARTVANMGTATHLQLKNVILNLYNSLYDACSMRWPMNPPQDIQGLLMVGHEYLVRGTVEARVKDLIQLLQSALLDRQSVVFDVALRKIWRQLQVPYHE